jgi:hypothetical protein
MGHRLVLKEGKGSWLGGVVVERWSRITRLAWWLQGEKEVTLSSWPKEEDAKECC